MDVSSNDVMAAAVGKAIAEVVTPAMCAEVFAHAFKKFMEEKKDPYSTKPTTRAEETLQEALRETLRKKAFEYLELPEQQAKLSEVVKISFEVALKDSSFISKLVEKFSRQLSHGV